MAALDKKFSVEFADHQGLIHKLTKKCWGRLQELKIYDHEYEDVFQINCIAYVKVSRAFNPELGYGFGAYLGRAIYNEFNKYAEKIINEKIELNLQSYEDYAGEDGDDFDFMSVHIADPSILNAVENNHIIGDEARECINKLSSTSKLIVRELLSPSIGLQKSFDGMKAHSELAKDLGEKYIRVPQTINIRAIKLHYGIKHRDMEVVKREFKEFLGVSLD